MPPCATAWPSRSITATPAAEPFVRQNVQGRRRQIHLRHQQHRPEATLGRAEYGIRMVDECNLTWQDFFVPRLRPQSRRAERRRAQSVTAEVSANLETRPKPLSDGRGSVPSRSSIGAATVRERYARPGLTTSKTMINRLCFALLLLAPALPGAALNSQLTEKISAALKQSGAPSVSVAVVRDGKLAFAQGFGSADLAAHRAADIHPATPLAPSPSSSPWPRC